MTKLTTAGHYARLDVRGELVRLKRGIDTVKDQTYFLSQLHQDQIRRAYFPIGELTKSDVRQLACELDLPNKDRRDSQGICFLGKIKYSEFVRHHLGERVGDIINTENGQVLGLHQGYWFYTIGQRQGLGLSHGPWFVQRKDPVRNIIYVTHGKRLEETSCDSYRVTNLHWVASPPAEQNLQVRIRHGPEFLEASVKLEADSATVQLAHKEAGIAPGQFTVFYDGDICLGGATVVP